MISQTAEYALRAVIHLAEHGEGVPLHVAEVARALGAPRNYLSKTLHELVREGFLSSSRGPAGGFRLAVSPEKLTLARVVSVFDPPPARRRCLLGRSRCSDEHPCGAHERWKEVAEAMAEFFRTTTVADLLTSAGNAEPAGVMRLVGARG
jgi:Rrf2 family protein